ncbi:MAG: hypothetical protein V3V67_07225, partial [Myxococcota bacterium]
MRLSITPGVTTLALAIALFAGTAPGAETDGFATPETLLPPPEALTEPEAGPAEVLPVPAALPELTPPHPSESRPPEPGAERAPAKLPQSAEVAEPAAAPEPAVTLEPEPTAAAPAEPRPERAGRSSPVVEPDPPPASEAATPARKPAPEAEPRPEAKATARAEPAPATPEGAPQGRGAAREPRREGTARRWAGRVEAALVNALAALPREWQPHVERLRKWATTRPGSWIGAGAACALLALFLALRLSRRPGDLIVCIEYPAELRGVFSVELFTRRPRLGGGGRGSEGGRRRRSTPTAHHMVARETEFERLRPRSYWVRLAGVLKNPDCPDGLQKEHAETRCIQVKRKQRVRLDFDLRAQGCPVDVKILWDGQPVREASVASFGRPETLRYARAGTARLELPIGHHLIVVGSGDRVAEIGVEVESRDAREITVDLSGGGSVVFKGCPPAIQPYLQGDLDAAASALEREGQVELAHALRGRLAESHGATERAAEHYEAAGLLQRAADLHASSGDYVRAARLLGETGDPDDVETATRLLERVGSDRPDFATASQMLATVYERRGHI